MAPMTKPETILKQAEGLVSVGQTHAALQSFTEMFSSKRFRTTPLASLEPIMIRFVELCVEMRKGRIAKEGLMQYKNTAQNTSVGSIEVVIQKFVSLADVKLQEAQEKAEKAAADAAADVDDLEATETPESILLGAVSGDQSRDRTDRALVTPWLKFLWESYRTALETLKNNARLQVIYHVRTCHLTTRPCLICSSIDSKSPSKRSNFVSSISERSNFDVFARPYASTSLTLQNTRTSPMRSTSRIPIRFSTTSMRASHNSTHPWNSNSGRRPSVQWKMSTIS
jgi:hypothetical protein